jgi:hypothetical protein
MRQHDWLAGAIARILLSKPPFNKIQWFSFSCSIRYKENSCHKTLMVCKPLQITINLEAWQDLHPVSIRNALTRHLQHSTVNPKCAVCRQYVTLSAWMPAVIVQDLFICDRLWMPNNRTPNRVNPVLFFLNLRHDWTCKAKLWTCC